MKPVADGVCIHAVPVLDLRAVFLRKRHDEPNGDQWITVTRVVEDPKYLTMPFITSESFKKEPDAPKWHPTPCQIDPPRQ